MSFIDVLRLIACGVVGYLLGSLNTAIMLSKATGLGDIREKGSGNAGLTNALRVYGKKFAAATLAGDLLKGVAAVLLAWFIAPAEYRELAGVIAGTCCILGHSFPLYFGFKGGKGVLTGLAVMLMITPIPALFAFAVFIIILLIWGYVSLGSIIAAATLPIFVFFRNYYSWQDGGLTPAFWMALALAVVIIIRHHSNIGRLLRGEENKLLHKKK